MTTLKQYVVIFADPGEGLRDEEVLLVQKDRPAWQAGRFNLLGGKVEDGETAIIAAVRELKEESGLVPVEHVYYSGMISGKNSMIHVITVPVDRDQPLQPREGETEIVSWHSWDDVEKDPRLLPNLRIAVPLLQRGPGQKPWSIQDVIPYQPGEPSHTVTLSYRDEDDKALTFNCKLGDPSTPVIFEKSEE